MSDAALPRPHAYRTEVLVNPGSHRARWEIDGHESETHDTLRDAQTELDEYLESGHAPDQVRTVAVTVVDDTDLYDRTDAVALEADVDRETARRVLVALGLTRGPR